MRMKSRTWIQASSLLVKISLPKDLQSCVHILALLSVYWEIDSSDWIPYIDRVVKIRRLSGTPYTVKWNKSNRLAFTRWMCGHPLKESDVPLHKDGFPRNLSSMKKYTSSARGIAFLLTLLIWSRGLHQWSKPDISAVLSPYTGKMTEDKWSRSPVQFLADRVRLSLGKPLEPWSRWHLTTRNGPNGHALTGILEDLKAITGSCIPHLTTLGGKKIVTYLSHFKVLTSKEGALNYIKERLSLRYQKESPSRLAKLIFIKDKELKMRSIGIGNYWYQAALKNLHDQLIDILRRIPEDATFDQGKAPRVLRKPEGHSYWSMDLTAATDRFPLWYQKKVIGELFSAEVAESWSYIITTKFSSREFGEVKYAVGQPIGFYSSWAAFAVSHHIVVHAAAIKAGIRDLKGLYVLLGDDIVLCHDDLAREYKIIIGLLGVELSISKTHQSDHTYEFAKRWYSDKWGEISPFPIHSVSPKAKYTDIIAIINSAAEKGWSPSSQHYLEFAAASNCLLHKNHGDEFYSRSLRFLNLYRLCFIASTGQGSWSEVIRNLDVARRTISVAGSAWYHPKYGEDLYQLTLLVIFLNKGVGKLATATKVASRTILNLIPRTAEPNHPCKGLWSVLINLPQSHIVSDIVDSFSKDSFLSLIQQYIGQDNKKLSSLITCDLNTVLTTRNQQLSWNVLHKVVQAIVVTISRVSEQGCTFRGPEQLPLEVVRAAFKPISNRSLAVGTRYVSSDNPLYSYWVEMKKLGVIGQTQMWVTAKTKGLQPLQQDTILDDPDFSIFSRIDYLDKTGKVSSYLYGERG
ncbi:RNA-dependent RNA polymerase [Cronartium ribicola mitovirus 1]|uniref:RNA-dependent RNA polymerase n=1 Tax=Cronartium ribicola mitovirus 1 TaxID=1816484 RepID=A0A191KCP6_9VIRU|nr:RNA-dependent RNA polymerase [Cronartium ribicola mitovirus 1]AMQ67414.1 RNA-dependent RNA polymerase [Cronartium ribicola mitovirus 1]